MYSSIQRDAEYVKNLLGFLSREYGIKSAAITPAKRGFYGETWKLDTENLGYFVKLDYLASHKTVYERSFPILDHLSGHGIDFISRIVKTSDGRLSTRYDGAVLGVFDWIDGDNIETDDTKIPEYNMLAKIYAIQADGILIPRDEFSGNSSDKFFEQWAALEDKQTCSLFEKNRTKLEHRAARLKHFSELCKSDMTSFVITHGDAGGNLIVNGDKYYIVDWDDPVFAPPERDAWNMLCYKGKEWASCVFHKALRENGIEYPLRPERLAYYCYYYFFFYLTEYLDNFTRPGIKQEIVRYFDGWADNRATFADIRF